MINNRFLGSEKAFVNVNLLRNAGFCWLGKAKEGMVDQAVQSTRQALKGPWGDLIYAYRAKYLRKITDGIEHCLYLDNREAKL